MFAKIYEVTGRQILVTKDLNDEYQPVICVSVRPPGFGICSHQVSVGILGEDPSDAKIDTAFDAMTEEKATEIAESIEADCAFLLSEDGT